MKKFGQSLALSKNLLIAVRRLSGDGLALSVTFGASSPFGSNGDDRRQRRKQGGAVGAAASKDASGSEADAGSRNPGSVTEGD